MDTHLINETFGERIFGQKLISRFQPLLIILSDVCSVFILYVHLVYFLCQRKTKFFTVTGIFSEINYKGWKIILSSPVHSMSPCCLFLPLLPPGPSPWLCPTPPSLGNFAGAIPEEFRSSTQN